MLRGIAVSISFFFLLAAPSCSREEARAPTATDPPVISFAEEKGEPARTIVVPTLDTPIPQGKSAIWCASFQLAWNELKKLARGPVQVENAEEIAARLNQAGDPQADLPAGSFYAKAGFTRDGIVETIRREMAEKFPGKTFPDFQAAPDEGDFISPAMQSIKFELNRYGTCLESEADIEVSLAVRRSFSLGI